MLTHLTRFVALLALAAALGGCAAWTAQNPGGALSPVNAVAHEQSPRLMLKGADVVAYFTQGKYQQGEARFASQHQDTSFWFSSAENKALFDKDPAKYLPEYGGYCANGIVYGIPWGGDADRFKLVNGKLYIFGGPGSLAAWNLNEKTNIALADKYWAEEVQGANSFIQRAKRLTFRVAHYKSGTELAQMVEQAKGKP